MIRRARWGRSWTRECRSRHLELHTTQYPPRHLCLLLPIRRGIANLPGHMGPHAVAILRRRRVLSDHNADRFHGRTGARQLACQPLRGSQCPPAPDLWDPRGAHRAFGACRSIFARRVPRHVQGGLHRFLRYLALALSIVQSRGRDRHPACAHYAHGGNAAAPCAQVRRRDERTRPPSRRPLCSEHVWRVVWHCRRWLCHAAVPRRLGNRPMRGRCWARNRHRVNTTRTNRTDPTVR